MPIRLLPVPALLAILFSCTPDSPEVLSPPNQWLVVGNDLGLRNEFIDMTNVVVTEDSSILVYSPAIPSMEYRYPLVDSVVQGSQNEEYHWQLQQINQDSLILIDSLKENQYYLCRLRRTDSIPGLADFLRSGELRLGEAPRWQYFLFAGDESVGSCYGVRRYRQEQDWSQAIAKARAGEAVVNPEPKLVGPPLRQESTSGYWRLEERFAQPIFVYTQGEDKHNIVLVDSLLGQEAIDGKLLLNYVPNRIQEGTRYWRDTSRQLLRNPATFLRQLDPITAQNGLSPDSIRTKYQKLSFSGRDLKKGLVVLDVDAPELTIDFSSDGYDISVAGRQLAAGKYEAHPEAPYLIVNGGCDNLNYWPYTLTDTSFLLQVPIKVELTGEFESRFGKGTATARRYYLDEWKVEFPLPTK